MISQQKKLRPITSVCKVNANRLWDKRLKVFSLLLSVLQQSKNLPGSFGKI